MSITKTALDLIRQKKIKELLKGILSFIERKTGIISLILMPYILIKINKMQSAKEVMDELYKDSLLGYLYRPIQIREELEALINILEKNKPRYVLEIGTARGGTLLLWTRAASAKATIISIDLPGGPFGGGYPWLRSIIYKKWSKNRQRIILIREDSHRVETLKKVKEILGKAKLDFLYIDGDHTYEGVKKDFEMYAPLVKRGGIIAFHDIVPGSLEKVGGVPKFWNEIKYNFYFKEIVKDQNQGGYGIGVIYV